MQRRNQPNFFQRRRQNLGQELPNYVAVGFGAATAWAADNYVTNTWQPSARALGDVAVFIGGSYAWRTAISYVRTSFQDMTHYETRPPGGRFLP